MRHGLVLTAAGHSTRFGGGSKVLATLAGVPVVVRAATPFLEALDDLDVVITAREDDREALEAVVRSTPALSRARVVGGGATRMESVRLGSEALAPEVGWVLVHDAARPCLTAPLVRRVLAAAKAVGAAVPGLAVADTIHRVDERGLVVESPRRETLRAVQTPQVARRDLLRRAYAHASKFALVATDEAGLLAAAGIPVAVVEGEPANVKLTTREDLEGLEARLGGR